MAYPPPLSPVAGIFNMSFDDHHDDEFLKPQHKSQYHLNSRIMLTAIFSLSIVVILVIILHIYARCIFRRQARRRATIHRLGLSTMNPQAHSTTEPPKTGLEPAVIALLPIFIFKQTSGTAAAGDDDNGEMMECAVCLSMLEEDEMARLLPNCKHVFHVACIDKWLSSHSTCPICRTEAAPRLHLENREPPITAAGGQLPPTAPPLFDCMHSSMINMEGTSLDDGTQSSSAKVVSGSSSRLNSFKRILSRERSSRRIVQIQSCGQEDSTTAAPDLERQ